MVSLRQTILIALLALAGAAFAQTTTTISLEHAGLNLRGLAFPDGVHGVAVGSAGLAMTSANAGITFNLHGTGTGEDLTALSMVDVQRGWAVGRGGVIRYTADGGHTWTGQNSGLTTDLLHVFAADAATSYTVGPNGVALKTTDGGQTWTPLSTGVSSQLNASFFFDVQTGIVVGNSATMLRTSDGGQTWTPIAPPAGFTGSLLSIHFADALHGWAGATQGRLLRTTDGGATWELVLTGSGYALFALAANGPDLVWASGGSASTGGIVQSADGGQTWTPAYATAGRIATLAIHSGHGWAAGDGGLVLHSTDLTTWTPVRQPYAGTANAIDFVDADPDHGWIAGSAGVMLHTTNGGQTWAAENTGSGMEWLDVHAITASTAVTAGGMGPIGGIYRWSAGSWSATSATAPAFQAVHFADAQHGWAAGANGTLQTTNDAGQTWTGQTSTTGEALTDVFFLNDQLGWAVGTGGVILKTTDGGASWTAVPSPGTAILYGVHFVDASTGYAVGSAGTVVKSTDGGNTWTELSVPTNEFLNAVFFANGDEGWIVGNNATLLHTDDGGQSWQPITSPVNVFLWDITPQRISNGSETVLFAAGNNGVVLRIVVTKPAQDSISLQCPPDVTVELLPGQASAVVTGPTPSASTTCPDGLSGITGGPSVSGFPIGVTTVTYVAADNCGNTASCQVTVSVNELTSCETKTLECVRFDLIDIVPGPGGSKKYRLAVHNACADAIDYVAFQLPAGIVATTPVTNSAYLAPSGRAYKVRNPNPAPFYSIRFRTGNGPANGNADLFEYQLPGTASPQFILSFVRFVSGKSEAAHLNVTDCLPPAVALALYGTDEPALDQFIWNHDDRFAAAPNPSTGLVTVAIPTRADSRKPLALFDARGGLLREFTFADGETSRTIDLSDLGNGPYWLRLWSHDGLAESILVVKQ